MMELPSETGGGFLPSQGVLPFATLKENIETGGTLGLSPELTTSALIEADSTLGAPRVTSVDVPTRSGSQRANLYLPAGACADAALVWVHGGGFIGGTIDEPESNWVGLWLASHGLPVISVSYRKAIHGLSFPAPSDDVLDAWNWFDGNRANLLGPDCSRVFLGGASAGANLAAGAALRLRDGHGQSPLGVVLAYPIVHRRLPPASNQRMAAIKVESEPFYFSPDWIAEMNDNYSSEPTDHAFPSLANLRGFPRTLIVNSEWDSIRLSGEAFGEMLAVAGVSVTSLVEPRSRHGHLSRPEESAGALTLATVSKWIESSE